MTSSYSKKTEYKLSVLSRADIQRLARVHECGGSRIARDKHETRFKVILGTQTDLGRTSINRHSNAIGVLKGIAHKPPFRYCDDFGIVMMRFEF